MVPCTRLACSFCTSGWGWYFEGGADQCNGYCGDADTLAALTYLLTYDSMMEDV